MGKIHILLYYKFKKVRNPEKYAREHLEECKRIGVLGKVLFAEEGINGSVSGTKEQTEKYKRYLRGLKGFSDIVFKEETGVMHPFEKMVVRARKQIIRLDEEVDMKKVGKYVSPKELLDMYERGEDMIVVDARNDYEYEAGRFKGALMPRIKTFREFPRIAEKLKNKKNKKIVMYCTGGIRCEKASAYMLKKGFKDVSQLEGGIITFCQQFPGTVWEGKCFVFDKRLISSVDSKNRPLTKCYFCGIDCDLYRNCKNTKCNYFMNCCPKCEKENKGCCSEKCIKTYEKNLLSNSTGISRRNPEISMLRS